MLVKAGSTPDLKGLSLDPPSVLADEERQELIERGPFGRSLVFNHPGTSPELCEQLRERVMREMVLVDHESHGLIVM